MPVSKRDRKVTLSKVGKKPKGREIKEAYVDKVRTFLQKYKRVLLVDVENPRNESLRMLKDFLPNSHLLVGKKNLVCLALGRDKTQSLMPNMHRLASELHDSRCLLLTDHTLEEVLETFEGPLRQTEFARSGFHPAPRTIRVCSGPLLAFSHTQEPMLRQLGLDTKLDKAIVILNKDAQLCKKGDKLTPEQCRLLKLFEQPLAEFRLHALLMWEDGKVKKLGKSPAKKESDAGDEDDDADVEMETDKADEDVLLLESRTLPDGTHCFMPRGE